ncbi:hypothetical protein HMPREF6745_0762 [Prevotella sp. oral taxon 472 str. F0295]|nr:hypothetical protein HMPREF6745_0762 [Prevotella sp. oral taxon 472 str. F0295]
MWNSSTFKLEHTKARKSTLRTLVNDAPTTMPFGLLKRGKT